MLIGIVGKPNVGKSTLFSALTLIDAARANYPFTTIKPNKGMGFVRIDCADKDLGVQCNPRTGICVNHKRYVPVELTDVAGLVPGASEGKGLGNQFLDDLRQADVLIQVIDASGSTDAEGKVVEEGSYDPGKDIAFLENEIDLWFFGSINKNWNKVSRKPIEGKSKIIEALVEILAGFGIKASHIDHALTKLNLTEKKLADWKEDDLKHFARALRERSKPILIAANKADLEVSRKKIEQLKKEFPHKKIFPCSAEAELSLKKAAKAGMIEYYPGNKEFKILKEMNDKQKQGLQLIQDKVMNVFNGTGCQDVLEAAVFSELGYLAIFPGGVGKLADSEGRVMPDCFLMPPHSTTLDFAYRLHTDIGKNFIKAINVKTRQLIGKDAELKNRDVIEIIFNK